MAELILASTSPRRRDLLGQTGRPFRVAAPTADETPPPGLTPEAAAEALAVRKARSVAAQLHEGLVLGADTLVALDDEIIGKPRDRAHAVAILGKLTRRPHRVITGVCMIDASTGAERTASETTVVTMRPMTPEEIDAYVDSGEALGKAGAYAIQETGDRFVEKVEGSFSNVVGLPLELVERLLNTIESQGDS